ncbi:hypothetical protein QTN47_23880 [Danxiaibacter flavus]|uniref:4-O-methyl-glucuronoyl methylesterase-like domain-containing protein n=1 Tax=Danxiaibacter flavus TaxID=3049108 RepID=A0ABV3ZPB0_9BACT|nr:hypothetical protein QNM32_23885 [Chitinophagaceae bacterium DXS]
MQHKTIACFIFLFTILFNTHKSSAQVPAGTNVDESKVKPYTLPDPLQMQDGKKVTNVNDWNNIQRPYIYHLFEENVYGRIPRIKLTQTFRVRETGDAIGGLATRKQIRIYLSTADTSAFIDLLLYLPKSKTKAPVFVGYNFNGNQTVQADPAIFISENPLRDSRLKNADGTASDSTRGIASNSWDVKNIIKNGIGLVTAYYGDIEVDTKDGWQTGIRTKLKDELKIQPAEWSAISAWAWGLMRIMDYLEQDSNIDAKHVALFGHSRLGKTALWTGATDQRFAMVISNESGEGGAALARRNYGETIKDLNERFPHWFVGKYRTYNNNASAMPVDQHMLLSLIAPRPLYVASAEDDQWSDPKGEFLSAVNAASVYALFGKKGLGTDKMPPLNTSVGNTIRYHERTGKHAVTEFDWQQYIKFVNEQFK